MKFYDLGRGGSRKWCVNLDLGNFLIHATKISWKKLTLKKDCGKWRLKLAHTFVFSCANWHFKDALTFNKDVLESSSYTKMLLDSKVTTLLLRH